MPSTGFYWSWKWSPQSQPQQEGIISFHMMCFPLHLRSLVHKMHEMLEGRSHNYREHLNMSSRSVKVVCIIRYLWYLHLYLRQHLMHSRRHDVVDAINFVQLGYRCWTVRGGGYIRAYWSPNKCIPEWKFRMEVHSRVEYLRGTKWPLWASVHTCMDAIVIEA